MEPQIRFCTTTDGVRIAYSVVGSGPPLVSVPGWISHQELDWQIPQAREAIETYAEHFTVIRLDKRGTGLSDRGLIDYSIEARARDLEAVADALKLDEMYLTGISEGGPVCLWYAVEHPERVRRMALYGTFVRGKLLGDPKLVEAVRSVVRAEWGLGSKLLSELFAGDDSGPFGQVFAAYQQQGATAEDALLILDGCLAIDITDILPRIQAPTLVIHARNDRVVPIELGREIAAGIPNARFASIDGPHVPFKPEQSAQLRQLELAFLLEGVDQQTPAVASEPRASGLVTLLFTDMESSTALTQSLGDERAQELLRQHNSAVREALKRHNGSEIKHTGDGIMASFPSARGALDAAIEIQRALTDIDGLRVRIGLNAGEPLAEDEDLYGTAVQLAARVCAQAEPGSILVSNVVRELAAGKGFLFSDRGEVPLRGFEDPVRLYEAGWSQ